MPYLLYRVCIESRVVPAMSVTMLRSSPNKALVIDDLPTLGRPTMVIRGRSSCCSACVSSGRAASMASIRSPVPLPDIELMQ